MSSQNSNHCCYRSEYISPWLVDTQQLTIDKRFQQKPIFKLAWWWVPWSIILRQLHSIRRHKKNLDHKERSSALMAVHTLGWRHKNPSLDGESSWLKPEAWSLFQASRDFDSWQMTIAKGAPKYHRPLPTYPPIREALYFFIDIPKRLTWQDVQDIYTFMFAKATTTNVVNIAKASSKDC